MYYPVLTDSELLRFLHTERKGFSPLLDNILDRMTDRKEAESKLAATEDALQELVNRYGTFVDDALGAERLDKDELTEDIEVILTILEEHIKGFQSKIQELEAKLLLYSKHERCPVCEAPNGQ